MPSRACPPALWPRSGPQSAQPRPAPRAPCPLPVPLPAVPPADRGRPLDPAGCCYVLAPGGSEDSKPPVEGGWRERRCLGPTGLLGSPRPPEGFSLCGVFRACVPGGAELKCRGVCFRDLALGGGEVSAGSLACVLLGGAAGPPPPALVCGAGGLPAGCPRAAVARLLSKLGASFLISSGTREGCSSALFAPLRASVTRRHAIPSRVSPASGLALRPGDTWFHAFGFVWVISAVSETLRSPRPRPGRCRVTTAALALALSLSRSRAQTTPRASGASSASTRTRWTRAPWASSTRARRRSTSPRKVGDPAAPPPARRRPRDACC